LQSAKASSPCPCELRMRAFMACVSPWLACLRRIWSAALMPSGGSAMRAGGGVAWVRAHPSCTACPRSTLRESGRGSAPCWAMAAAWRRCDKVECGRCPRASHTRVFGTEFSDGPMREGLVGAVEERVMNQQNAAIITWISYKRWWKRLVWPRAARRRRKCGGKL
jgi:hypothetical protein